MAFNVEQNNSMIPWSIKKYFIGVSYCGHSEYRWRVTFTSWQVDIWLICLDGQVEISEKYSADNMK